MNMCCIYITWVLGKPAGLSKKVCLYTSTDWLKLTCQSEGGKRSADNQMARQPPQCCSLYFHTFSHILRIPSTLGKFWSMLSISPSSNPKASTHKHFFPQLDSNGKQAKEKNITTDKRQRITLKWSAVQKPQAAWRWEDEDNQWTGQQKTQKTQQKLLTRNQQMLVCLCQDRYEIDDGFLIPGQPWWLYYGKV